MNDNILGIRTLVDSFFDGETTLDEEQQLYAYFRQPPAELPEDLLSLRDMFLDLAAVRYVAVSPQQRSHRRWPRWAAAAAIVVFVTLGSVTYFTRSTEGDDDCVAYIYGRRTTDRTVVLTEMQKTMTVLAATDGSDIVEEQLKAMFDN